MLTRQWQLGEFQAEDTGSPSKTQLETISTRLSRLGFSELDSHVSPIYNQNIPLETLVERETLDDDLIDWRTRIQVGQQFERLVYDQVNSVGLNDTKRADSIITLFKEEFKVDIVHPEDLDNETRQFLDVVSKDAIDGGAMLQEPGMVTHKPVLPKKIKDNCLEKDISLIVKSLKKLHEWFTTLYSQVDDGYTLTNEESPAWKNEKLEHEFSVSAPEINNKQTVLTVKDYSSGNIEWYDFSIHHDPNKRLGQDNFFENSDGDEREIITEDEPKIVMPSELRFQGMPNLRWWEFEDQMTDFGDVDLNVTDLAKVLVMDFALLYGNDWFLLPIPLEVGSLCRIKNLTITDVFGVSTPVKRVESKTEELEKRTWNMFNISTNPTKNINPDETEVIVPKICDFLFIPPTVGYKEESSPIEEVRFLRDEMANMIWGVEHTIANGLRNPISGHQAFQEGLARSEENKFRSEVIKIKKIVDELGNIAEEANKAIMIASESTTLEKLIEYTEKAFHILRELRLEEPSKLELQVKLDEIQKSLGLREQDESSILRYRLASVVPENWIPFIPVQSDQGRRQIQLRRALMIRNLDDELPLGIDPKTRLLRPIDSVNEETFFRSGLRMNLTLQRARWIDGSTHLWFGRNKGPGHSEGSSGLKFDLLLE